MGYGEADDTWEPITSLTSASKPLAAFKAARRKEEGDPRKQAQTARKKAKAKASAEGRKAKKQKRTAADAALEKPRQRVAFVMTLNGPEHLEE